MNLLKTKIRKIPDYMGSVQKIVCLIFFSMSCVADITWAGTVVADHQSKISAEVVVGAIDIPTDTTASFTARDVVQGEGLTIITQPLLDADNLPLVNYQVVFELEDPVGSIYVLNTVTTEEGIVHLTLDSELLKKPGEYTLTSSADALLNYTQSFYVLAPTKGGVIVGPNPFTPAGNIYNSIKFVPKIPGQGIYQLKIFRLDGANVFSKQFSETEEISWRGDNFSHHIVPAGIYIWQLEQGEKRYNGTLVVIK